MLIGISPESVRGRSTLPRRPHGQLELQPTRLPRPMMVCSRHGCLYSSPWKISPEAQFTINPKPGQWSVDPPFDERVRQLVRDWGEAKSPGVDRGNDRDGAENGARSNGGGGPQADQSFVKEMRYAAKVFAPFHHFRKVVVFGSARIPPGAPEFQVAEDFAREMVAHNYMVITGGGDGIMGAAQRGAGREHSFGLNIRLPFEQRANEIIEGDPKLITFNYFFTRKLNFVKETHAFALFPGGFGTLDETFEVLTLMQTGKARIIPVVLFDRPRGTYWETWMKFVTEHLFKLDFISQEDFSFSKSSTTSERRSRKFCSFYKIYHSARWVG